MPNLKEMLGQAREEEAQKKKRSIVKGIRPDRILRGEVDIERGELFEDSEADCSGFTIPTSVSQESKGPVSCDQISKEEVKPEPQKSEQTQNKLRTNPHHNPEQSQNKPRTKPEQFFPAKIETQNKPPSQPRTEPRTKSEQTQNKVRTNGSFISLVGLQRRIIFFVYSLCRGKGERNTGAVSLEQLSDACETTPGAAQVTVRRLMNKALLLRVSFKNGRGGWTVYELPEHVYGEVFQLETQNKVRTNQEQTQNKVISQPRTQPRTAAPSSSSSLRSISNKEELLTTGEGVTQQFELDAVWQKIDCSPLNEIRFGRHQVEQIAREGKFTPEELQDSIYAFAFDLSENGKAKTITGVPLNYFMGILRRGPYAAPSNYESPDIRQKRLYLESKELQRKKRQELDERLETVEFEEWLEKLSLDQRAAIVPPKDFAKPGSTAHNYQMREYFRENVWPVLRDKAQGQSDGEGLNPQLGTN